MQFTAEKKFVLKKIKLVSKKSNKFPKKKKLDQSGSLLCSKQVCLSLRFPVQNI